MPKLVRHLVGPFTGEQQPVRPGVYKREVNGNMYYSYWGGVHWYLCCHSVTTATTAYHNNVTAARHWPVHADSEHEQAPRPCNA